MGILKSLRLNLVPFESDPIEKGEFGIAPPVARSAGYPRSGQTVAGEKAHHPGLGSCEWMNVQHWPSV